MPKPASAGSLRQQILEQYISTNAGPHRPLDQNAADAFGRAYRHHLRGWIQQGRGGRWLDLGCGQGALMRLASSVGYEQVSGVDISEEMLATCRANGLAVEHADVWEYLARTPDSHWNVVSAFDLLEHFPKEDGFRLLTEIRRVLAPGGICLVKVPNAASPWGFGVTASDLTHEAVYTPYSLIQLATLSGFTRTDVREVGPVPSRIVSRTRFVLWRGLRSLYAAMNIVETGSAGFGIYTQVMIGRLAT